VREQGAGRDASPLYVAVLLAASLVTVWLALRMEAVARLVFLAIVVALVLATALVWRRG
jgi:hypothetical protein